MKFDEYYSQYYRRIIAFARSYVNDEMVAQDIAAESMVKLWMHLKEHPDADIHHWLFVIVKNLCLDYLKHQRIKQKTLAEAAVVVENLVKGSGRAVGRDEEEAQRRFLGGVLYQNSRGFEMGVGMYFKSERIICVNLQ